MEQGDAIIDRRVGSQEVEDEIGERRAVAISKCGIR
jgi:hypothetical protein